MLAKKFRLPIKEWIKENKKKVTIRKTSFFILKISLNNLSISRFGVIIKSKIFKSAVKRNYLKRKIFDFIEAQKIYGIPGRDFLIIVLPSAIKLVKKEIEKELKTIFYDK